MSLALTSISLVFMGLLFFFSTFFGTGGKSPFIGGTLVSSFYLKNRYDDIQKWSNVREKKKKFFKTLLLDDSIFSFFD